MRWDLDPRRPSQEDGQEEEEISEPGVAVEVWGRVLSEQLSDGLQRRHAGTSDYWLWSEALVTSGWNSCREIDRPLASLSERSNAEFPVRDSNKIRMHSIVKFTL